MIAVKARQNIVRLTWDLLCVGQGPQTTSFGRNIPSIYGYRPLTEVKPGKERRILSVGCSKGNEVYEIAAGEYLLAQRNRYPVTPIRVFGFDYSEQCLAKARKGVYLVGRTFRTSCSDVTWKKVHRLGLKPFMEELPETERPSTRKPGISCWRFVEPIRQMVGFTVFDLKIFDPGAFAPFDEIHCYNCLIPDYFDEQFPFDSPVILEILNKLVRMLKPGGILSTNQALNGPHYQFCHGQTITLYRMPRQYNPDFLGDHESCVGNPYYPYGDEGY